MGAACPCGVGEGLHRIWKRRRYAGSESFQDCIDPEDSVTIWKVEAKRERILTLIDECDDEMDKDSSRCSCLPCCYAFFARDSSPAQPPTRRSAFAVSASRLERFFTADEGDWEEVLRYHKEFKQGNSPNLRSLKSLGGGPWGDPEFQGATGSSNSWTTIQEESYKVRGPSYLEDKKKVASEGIGVELLVVDLFETDHEIRQISEDSAVGTVQRLRRRGESRQLLLLNFRILPLQLVIAWAVPELGSDASPALALLHRFMSESMSDEERNTRAKVIPRLNEGPTVAKWVVGETPAILGKNIPIEFYRGDQEFEMSIGITSSASASRVLNVLKPAAQKIDIEVALVIEGKEADELPEAVVGGFRMCYPDTSTVRWIES